MLLEYLAFYSDEHKTTKQKNDQLDKFKRKKKPKKTTGLKENSGRKKVKLKEKSVKNAKNEPSLTSMRQMVFEISYSNVINLSNHFVGSQPHPHLTMTPQTQSCKTMKK